MSSRKACRQDTDTAADFSFHTVLWPVLETFLARYPDINVEVNCDYRLVDILADRYDAGVRYGDTVGEGMIATRIAPDMRMAVVVTRDKLDTVKNSLITPERPA
jgi:DNA-binding transcriptional LysR family regulator